MRQTVSGRSPLKTHIPRLTVGFTIRFLSFAEASCFSASCQVLPVKRRNGQGCFQETGTISHTRHPGQEEL
jgi:hypothetical protein